MGRELLGDDEGLLAIGLSELADTLRTATAAHGVPAAAAAIVSRDAVSDCANEDAIFRIASMTKPVTSLAAMILCDEGAIALDDPVTRHLPDYVQPQVVTAFRGDGAYESRSASRAITIHDLLTNTSGIAYPDFHAELRKIHASGVPPFELPLLHDPGAAWTYGPGTGLLGRLIARVSGTTLDEFCKARIFDPLGMADTAYAVPDAKRHRVVTIHQRSRDGVMTERPNPPGTIASKGRGDDGLFSTAADYARFVQLFLNKGRCGGSQIASARAIDQMGSNQIGSLTLRAPEGLDPAVVRAFPRGAGTDKFGFGFQIESAPGQPGRRRPGSLSWTGVFNTHFWIDPAAGVGGVVLMQYLPANEEGALGVLDAVEALAYARRIS